MSQDDDDYNDGDPVTHWLIVACVLLVMFGTAAIIIANENLQEIDRHPACIDGHWHMVIDAGPPLLILDDQDQAVTCKEGDHEPQ